VSLSTRIKVPLPEHGVIVTRSSRRHYVYKVVDTFRNAKGQPTNTRTMVGRLDEATGLLIPNDAYWQEYGPGPVEVLGEPDAVRAIGAEFLVTRVLDGLGVAGMLDQALGRAVAGQVTQAACYMARRGNVIDGIEDWVETSTLAGAPGLTSPSASRLFASIGHAQQMRFFKLWAAAQAKDSYLAYDVTSFSTRAEGIAQAEWGYNRDKEKIPQVNFGCYLNQSTGLPVFYTVYPGSILDKSHLVYMMAHNKDLGIHDATFVMDRGFATTANIGYLHSEHLPYLAGLDIRYKAARHAVDQVRADMVTMANRVGASVYARPVSGRFYGQTATLHVFYDPVLGEARRTDLERVVADDQAALAQLDQLTRKQAAHYRRYHRVDLTANGSFTFQPDQARIEAAAANAGFFTILTSTSLASREVLEVYKRRDAIEKGFDDLKNHVDMRRLRTWSDQTTEGKMFCAFIALIAVCEIQAKTGPVVKAARQSLGKKDILAEMDKIKIVDTDSGRRLINPATKLQRDILKAHGLTEDDLKTHAATPPA